MKILVTGAAGFLGSHLCDALISAGHEVQGIDSLVGGYRDNVPKGVYFRVADIRWGIADFIQGCDAVYHCAALAYEGLSVFSPGLIVDNVVGGSVAVMTAAASVGVKRFVNCSSMSRYGNGNVPFHEAARPNPVDPYGIAKLSAERLLDNIGATHGVEVVHAVPHNIIGPRQKYDDPYRNVASIMVNRLLQGKPVVIYGDGKQTRCFSYVGDVVPTLVQLLDAKVDHGEIFNVGPDACDAGIVTINYLAERIAEILGVPLDIERHKDRPREVKNAWCCADKIRDRFGFEQKTELDEALRSIIDYVKTRGVRPFDYHLPLELTKGAPDTWRNKLI